MEKIKPIHQNEIPTKKKFIKQETDFGLHIQKENMGDYFCNDPSKSKISLDYSIFEKEKSEYSTEYINTNCMKL